MLIHGRYNVIKELTPGGFGRVFLVEDVHIHTMFVAKCVNAGHIAELEFRNLRELSHPGLPRLHDVIRDGKNVCIIMEYIKGRTLDVYLNESFGLSKKEVIRIGTKLLDILGYMHTRSIPMVYGDLKPQNIIIKENGDVALIDLGGIRYMCDMTREIYATCGYAAPEQLKGEFCIQSDIYAFGKIMQYLLTGYDPFFTDTMMTEDIMKRYGVQSGIAEIVIRCCKSESEKRYPDALQVKKDMERFGSELQKDKITGFFPALYCCIGVFFAILAVFSFVSDMGILFPFFVLLFLVSFSTGLLFREAKKTENRHILMCEYSICLSDFDACISDENIIKNKKS